MNGSFQGIFVVVVYDHVIKAWKFYNKVSGEMKRKDKKSWEFDLCEHVIEKNEE